MSLISLTSLPAVGPKTLEKLAKLNILAPKDLLFHFPSRYIDFSHRTSIRDAQVNTNVSITGTVLRFQNIFTRFHKNIQKAVVSDDTGYINLVWFNQPYIGKNIKVGDEYSFAGAVTLNQGQKTIIAPEYGPFNTGKIIPVYPETKGLTSKWFRKSIQTNLADLLNNTGFDLPQNILGKYKILSRAEALRQIHSPSNSILLDNARYRLGLDEILALQATSYLQRQQWATKKPAKVLKYTRPMQKIFETLIQSLPYTLTTAQTRVWHETLGDLTSATSPANRLIQGDVGSGKTIIALFACLLAHLNKTQTLMVAPTEILANQHFTTFRKILGPDIPISLLTGSSKTSTANLKKASIIIATHAAFYKHQNTFSKLSVLIVDEQHKFGVKQRSFLSDLPRQPHSLTMTATPIPRTLSLTLLGNLSLSYIDEMPASRLPVKTFLVPNPKITDCYHWVEKEIIKNKTQVYIVCPFIEESEGNNAVKAATAEFEYLKTQVFPHLKLALIHGKTPLKDREKNIADFKDNKVNILVTTPIIEVGIDIPNASIMVIQSADHFGLAQLHQLRGRVGRGSAQSYCCLFTESTNPKAIERLQYLEKHVNGLKIAEYDLKLRGPGEIFSFIQHGFPSLKLTSLNDTKIISDVQTILQDLLTNHPDFDISQLTALELPTPQQLN